MYKVVNGQLPEYGDKKEHLVVDHHEVIKNEENRYIIPIYRVELIPKVRWNECIR